jgi:hypothetical protein
MSGSEFSGNSGFSVINTGGLAATSQKCVAEKNEIRSGHYSPAAREEYLEWQDPKGDQ